MPRMSKVELFAAIRMDSRAGCSGRAIATTYRVSRHTVSDALTSAWPRERKPSPPRRSSVLGPFKTIIDDILRADLDAPRKQQQNRETNLRLENQPSPAGAKPPAGVRSARGWRSSLPTLIMPADSIWL
jgi:hypothetical protein